MRPNLVSHVEHTNKPPTLTYHIRPEARWSDGIPVSAKDFVFTYQKFRKYLPDDPESQEIRGVRVLDAKTVRVVLRSRYSGWKYLFSIVLPRHALQGQDLENIWTDRIDNPNTGKPIGSGPFLLSRFERGKQLTYVRNPRYWGPHTAYLDRLILRFGFVGSAGGLVAVEQLRKGELDIYQARLDPEPEPGFLTIPGVEHFYGDGQGWEHFEIRIGAGGHPALRNKLVRRALAYGLDRQAMVRTIFGKFVPKMRPSDSAVFLPRSPHYRPNWNGYRYRPAEARRLLEQAGCRQGSDGIYVCAGERLSLRFSTGAGASRRRLTLELAQRQLRQAGMEVKPRFGSGTAFEQMNASGDWDVQLFTQFYLPDQGSYVGLFGCGGQDNLTGYCQRLVTSDFNQADLIFDARKRAPVMNRADARMAKDVPVIPLWSEPTSATVRSTIRGFEPSFPSPAWNAENWWLAK